MQLGLQVKQILRGPCFLGRNQQDIHLFTVQAPGALAIFKPAGLTSEDATGVIAARQGWTTWKREKSVCKKRGLKEIDHGGSTVTVL